MATFKYDHKEILFILAAVWLWKTGELIYKEIRSDLSTPSRFGYIVIFDVPIFVTIGLSLLLLLRMLEKRFWGS